MPSERARTWVLLVAAVAVGAGGCRARDAAVERTSASLTALALGSPCTTDTECASGFCIDAVCCDKPCGGGVRDALSCSNVYGAVSGLTDGTCTALKPGDPCGALSSINPCTWRGSTLNGGGNCPNPPDTTGTACFPCKDNSNCNATFPVCVNGACVQCNSDADCGTSGTCDLTQHACGLPNGAPCVPPTDLCRSGVCFAGDDKCGLPDGEPCSSPTVCRSQVCAPTGRCAPCGFDADCGPSDSGLVCDDVDFVCKPGCRGSEGNGCGPGATCTSSDTSIGACITVEGGGPSCSAAPLKTANGASSSWWITVALLGLTLRTMRRGRR